MPKSESNTITIYCVAACLDGKGKTYEVGQKLELDEREKANHLLASGRFSESKEEAEAAAEKAQAAEKAKGSADAAAAEIAKLKKENAELKKAAK